MTKPPTYAILSSRGAYRLIFNFKDNSGALGYLNGKQVNLDPTDIWFVKNFAGGAEKISAIVKASR